MKLQRIPMGSHQEPDPPYLPFGYAIPIESIDPGLDNAMEIPPAGSQLLSADDTLKLEQFFSADFPQSVSFDAATQVPVPPLALGEGVEPLLYECSDLWLIPHLPNDDSFSQSLEALTSYQYISPSDTMAAPPTPTGGNLNQPADVLAAASVLSSGANGTHMNMSFGVSPMPTTSAAQMRYYSMGGYGSAESNMIPRNANDGMLASMVFGHEPSARPMNRRPQQHPEIQYGTDPNFSKPRYEAPYIGELQASRQQQAKIMNCFQRTDSAAPTRASSPVPMTRELPKQLSLHSPIAQTSAITMPQPNQPAVFSGTMPDEYEDEDEGTPPRKKSKCKADPADEAAAGRLPTKPKGARTGKVAVARSGSSPTTDEPAPAPPKKRKRKDNRDETPPKQRENLTAEQKRENHIKSEQKRRQVISSLFDDLVKVVPGLETSGMSKSGQLQQAGVFVEDLLSRNKRLRAQLEALKAAEGPSNGSGSKG
ncbi:hypothetical protein QBC34DRAFT_390215 [Podospora aff. communis PSN243]|uniref:BHLH domain-containing protein n=1 Tax=Podospora aff. communis PSN243 TaxID=3040156 RepID=A0AAV9H537_9PEZI|nr:hypothetical protein QBC34DRAFT_390215 [Podospora aff. communis PSN243]